MLQAQGVNAHTCLAISSQAPAHSGRKKKCEPSTTRHPTGNQAPQSQSSSQSPQHSGLPGVPSPDTAGQPKHSSQGRLPEGPFSTLASWRNPPSLGLLPALLSCTNSSVSRARHCGQRHVLSIQWQLLKRPNVLNGGIWGVPTFRVSQAPPVLFCCCLFF